MALLTPELLPLELLGARSFDTEKGLAEGLVYFGIILPPTTDHKSAIEGYDLWLRIIHVEDQFLKTKVPIEVKLSPNTFSNVASELYEKLRHQKPISAAQAYSFLRALKDCNTALPSTCVQKLLDYKPYEIDDGQPFFWSCIFNLKDEEKKRDPDIGEKGKWSTQKNSYVYRYCLKRLKEGASFAPQIVDDSHEIYSVGREIDWIIDPFAREFGQGKLSALTCGASEHAWDSAEGNWKVPALKDLICYEMMFDEFDEDINGAIDRIDYLQDLGINCISLMPITNVDSIVDWGYNPIGYFGIDERFDYDSRQKFKTFMQKAHKAGIAVTFDAVYAQTSPLFCYHALYEHIFIDDLIEQEQAQCQSGSSEEITECKRKIEEKYRVSNARDQVYEHQNFPNNPFMGAFSRPDFGKSVDFSKKFTQDFFFTVSYYWLDEFHIDGFRYDYVPGFYFPKNLDSIQNLDLRVKVKEQLAGKSEAEKEKLFNQGFKLLAQEIFKLVDNATKRIEGSIPINYVDRFQNGHSLIQAAENLDEPIEILNETEANCTWQNNTLRASESVAAMDRNNMEWFGLQLGLYSSDKINDPQKTQMQYIENHDNKRFVCNFGLMNDRGQDGFQVFKEGDRNRFGYKVQPYLIALLTSKGIPLLWQGQEFCENNYLDPTGGSKGLGRIRMFRPIRWEYFYDDLGQASISLIRKLTSIRLKKSEFQPGTDDKAAYPLGKGEQFRSLHNTSYYFHNDPSHYQSKGVLVYYRFTSCHGEPTEPFSIIMLNFTDKKQTIQFHYPKNTEGYPRFPEGYRKFFIDELSWQQYLMEKQIGKQVKPPEPEEIYDGKDLSVNSNYGCIWTTFSGPLA